MSRTAVLALFACAVFSLTGCGASYVPVNGVVKLDGAPVEGATVVFTTEDGNHSFSGFTDANGEFSLGGGAKPGALPGTYKVTVVKTGKVKGAEEMTPGGEDYVKHMQKDVKKDSTKPTVGKIPGPGLPSQQAGVKSELPAVYATTSTTPLTFKVPPDTQPLLIDLTGGTKGKK